MKLSVINYVLSTAVLLWRGREEREWRGSGFREDVEYKSELLATSSSQPSPPAFKPWAFGLEVVRGWSSDLWVAAADSFLHPDSGSLCPLSINEHKWILSLSLSFHRFQHWKPFLFFLYTYALALDCTGTLVWGLGQLTDYVDWLLCESFYASSSVSNSPAFLRSCSHT